MALTVRGRRSSASTLEWKNHSQMRSRRRVLSDPRTARYIAGWPRETDLGVPPPPSRDHGSKAGFETELAGVPDRVTGRIEADPHDQAHQRRVAQHSVEREMPNSSALVKHRFRLSRPRD